MIAKVLVTFLLLFVLFLSSFDSFGIDGIVPLIQQHFGINDAEIALIRTSSSISNTIALVCVWLLGDAIDRRILFFTTVTFWIASSVLCIVLGSDSFMIFVILRSFAAAASAIFGVLVPVIFADIFKDRSLGIVYMCMTASDIVSGMSMGILNSWIVSSGLPWQTGLIAGPVLAIPPLCGLICMHNQFHIKQDNGARKGISRMFSNAFSLFSVKSYLLLTATQSLGTFFMRAYLFWQPSLILSAWKSFPDAFGDLSYPTVTTLTSFTMIIASVIALPIVLWFAQSWYHGTGPFMGRDGYIRSYPIVVSFGASLNAGMSIVRMLVMERSLTFSLIALFISGLGSAADLSLSQQMMMMVTPMGSRAAAIALSRLVSSVVSTPSAQLVGMLSDTIRGESKLESDRFYAYLKALLYSSSFMIASAVCDFVLVVFFPGDCEAAEEKEGEIDECTPIKGRTDSALDSIVKSRSRTVSCGYQW